MKKKETKIVIRSTRLRRLILFGPVERYEKQLDADFSSTETICLIVSDLDRYTSRQTAVFSSLFSCLEQQQEESDRAQ